MNEFQPNGFSEENLRAAVGEEDENKFVINILPEDDDDGLRARMAENKFTVNVRYKQKVEGEEAVISSYYVVAGNHVFHIMMGEDGKSAVTGLNISKYRDENQKSGTEMSLVIRRGMVNLAYRNRRLNGNLEENSSQTTRDETLAAAALNGITDIHALIGKFTQLATKEAGQESISIEMLKTLGLWDQMPEDSK